MLDVGPRGRLLGCMLASFALAACGGASSERGRVLLVGIDGATLKIARPMLESGELPNLARMAQQGVYGPLRAHAPITSPRIWTSIATGKAPQKHGVLGFAKTAEDGSKQLYASSDRKVHALWNIVSKAGLSVAVVNWWTTYPVETVNGVMVSDHLLSREVQGRRNLTGAVERELGPIVHPAEWEERVRTLLASSDPLTEVPDPFAAASEFPDWAQPERLSERYRDDGQVTRIALAIERELRPDVMLVFLPGIDRVSHRLWGAIEPDDAHAEAFTNEQREAAAAALRNYYVYTDALIGELLRAYGPDDLTLVVSDHGFEAGSSMIFLTGEHKSAAALHGLIVASGPGIAAPGKGRPVSVNDVTPTILAWLGLPIGDDMDGRPAGFLAREPSALKSIPTHDTTAIDRIGAGPSGFEEARLEELRALGYMETDEEQ